MGVESLQTLAIIFLIASGVLFLLAIILFFVLKIPKMFGIVTGISAAKGIKEIQDRTEHQSDELQQNQRNKRRAREGITRKIKRRKAEIKRAESGKLTATSPLTPAKKQESMPTTLLRKDETTGTAKQTQPQIQQPQPAAPAAQPQLPPDGTFLVVQEFSFTSSNEIIE
ncbi:MAG TPA: hypothetical protein DCG49_13430 [Ruminococcus sp.]|nr:hypothetical protein [Ruminococcus sp.]